MVGVSWHSNASDGGTFYHSPWTLPNTNHFPLVKCDYIVCSFNPFPPRNSPLME